MLRVSGAKRHYRNIVEGSGCNYALSPGCFDRLLRVGNLDPGILHAGTRNATPGCIQIRTLMHNSYMAAPYGSMYIHSLVPISPRQFIFCPS